MVSVVRATSAWSSLVLALALTSLPPAPAQAQKRCVRILGWQSFDCPVEVERGPDRVEGAFWRRRGEGGNPNDRSVGPVVPGIGPMSFVPGPLGGTREGRLTIDDLGLRPDGRGGFVGQRPGYRFDIEPDGTIHFRDRPPVQGLALVGLGFAAVFDLTDLVMRARKMDPYSYDKGRVLELTGKMRLGMSDVERPRRLAAAVARLPAELEALWGRRDLSPAQRRETLFQLWDDLLEGPGPGTGAAEVEAALRARGLLLQFVQRRLGRGTPDAFTPDELARFNARRRSRVVFDPYSGGR
jgi:hypothetical protein